MNVFTSMHVCGCVGVQLRDRCRYCHGLDVSCACNWISGWLGCALGVGVLHIIFKETCLTIYVRIYVYVMLLFYMLFCEKIVCSRKATFYVTHRK